MIRHLATVGRKNSLLTGRNLWIGEGQLSAVLRVRGFVYMFLSFYYPLSVYLYTNLLAVFWDL